MRTHISIKLVGETLGTFYPIGATIQYGLNMVPQAVIQLDANHLGLLCNFEPYRRTNATLYIDTIEGCLRFDGLIDGLSFFQGAGSLQAELVLKSKFQILMEMYPRMPGFHPTSISVFNRIATLKINASGAPNNIMPTMDLSSKLSFDMNTTVVDFFKRAMSASLKAQQDLMLRANTGQDLQDLIEVSQEVAAIKIPIALQLIDAIDTSPTDKMLITASDPMILEAILKHVQNSTGTLLEDFMLKLSHYGCALVIGNNKAFIIPESGFLQVPHNLVGVGKVATTVNTIYPAEYDSVSFSDGGYVDIKAIYAVSDENVTILTEKLKGELGKFIDFNSQGGIKTISFPDYVSLGLTYSLAKNNLTCRDRIANRTCTVKGQITEQAIKNQYNENYRKRVLASNDLKQKFLDNWAQMKYLQTKYTDRAGSINSIFSPNWAPGAVGTLYTRHPGTFMDFFVHSVTHRFNIGPPNTGTATTTIGFNCGRMGASTVSAGMDRILLFDYDYTDARAFSNAFVTDVTT